MRCTNCGFENGQDFRFCPSCGTEAQSDAPVQSQPKDPILTALKDTLFLVICILMSAACLLSLTGGNLPLINILSTIFLWLTYAQSRKDIADWNHLRCVSGTVFAQYVINYVLAGVVLLVGVILAAAFTFLASDAELFDSVLAEVGEIPYAAEVLASLSGGLLLVACAVAAAVIIVFNILFTRQIHRFAQSVYRSVQAQTLSLQRVKAAKNWLFVGGVFSAVGALSSLGGEQTVVGLASGCIAAAEIIAGILIRKHLSPEN